MDNDTFNPTSPSQPYQPYQEEPNNYQPVMSAPAQPAQPTPQPSQPSQYTGQPLQGQAPKKFIFAGWSTFQLVIFIVISLLAVTFIGLFVWMFVMWQNADADVQSQIDSAVASTVNDTETKLQAEFEEQEKYPYKTFVGPADYGELTFEYPKTWSAYVSKDAASGGDFEAYLNPDVVSPVSTDTINALRVIIKDQSIDQVVRTYESALRQGNLSVAVRPINEIGRAHV